MVELEDFSQRIAGIEPRPYMLGQIESAVNFVHDIATKKEGEEVRLDFNRAQIKLKIILVARAETILDLGVEPYIDRVKNALKQMNTVYLIIWEKNYLKRKNPEDFFRYRKRCNELDREIGRLPGVIKHFEVSSYEYIDPNGKKREGRLIRYLINAEKLAKLDNKTMTMNW